MASVFKSVQKVTEYRDRQWKGTQQERIEAIKKSTTVYIGNLSFYTTEEQIHELLSKAGEIRRIIMGLDSYRKTPCGFCFVEYFTIKAAERALHFINRTRLDNRPIRIDKDPGFLPGRQFGRGKYGGQVRDEYRTVNDPDRGGGLVEPTIVPAIPSGAEIVAPPLKKKKIA